MAQASGNRRRLLVGLIHFCWLAVLAVFVWSPLLSAQADGGAEPTPTPQPDDKFSPGGSPTTNPVQSGATVTPTQGSVSSFMIEVGPGKTPTVLVMTLGGTQAAALANQQAQSGGTAGSNPDKIESPLWLIAFFFIVGTIVAFNSLRNRIRN